MCRPTAYVDDELSMDTNDTGTSLIILSPLDYCSSLFAGSSKSTLNRLVQDANALRDFSVLKKSVVHLLIPRTTSFDAAPPLAASVKHRMCSTVYN